MRIVIGGDFYPNESLGEILKQPPKQILDNEILIGFQNADLSILNLECPLIKKKQKKIKKTGPHLRGTPLAAQWLSEAKIDLVTLANNHIMDYGVGGLKETLFNLAKSEVESVGAGMSPEKARKPFIFKKEGEKLAVLNFAENEWSTTHKKMCPGANPIDPINNFSSIQEAKSKADFVLVVTHGGHEMYSLPSPQMKKRFRFYIDAGANAVINHHTHYSSGFEWYKKAPIFYSLGNFFFPNPLVSDRNWQNGLLAFLTFDKSEVSLDLKHLTQCDQGVRTFNTNDEELESRILEMKQWNEIIQDDERLCDAFEKWISKKTIMYKSYIEPHSFWLLQALQNRGLIPSLWSKRKKSFLLNLIRCESHREILQSILENETGNTQK